MLRSSFASRATTLACAENVCSNNSGHRPYDASHLRSRMQAPPTLTRLQPASRPYFYQRFLSASVAFEYVACLLGKVFLICDKFGSMLSLSISMLSKMASNTTLSSNFFWFPLNFSYTTSLSNLLLCSICFSFSSNFFSKKSLNMENT